MDAEENKIYTAVLIASLVIGAIITYFIISIIRQQKRNIQLQKKNIIAEIDALEKDRARIARDLHDEVGPMLSGIKLKINSFDLNNKDDVEVLENTNDHIDQLLNRMREISFDLMPDALIRKGLVPALRQLVNYFSGNNELKIDFSADDNIHLSKEKEISIYRIVQEIFHNVIKHSGASCLTLKLLNSNNRLLLEAKDNGRGFDINRTKDATGFGLRSIWSRTELIDGELYLESTPGQGTQYQIIIPV